MAYATKTKTRATTKAAKVEEVDDEDEDELEEVEETPVVKKRTVVKKTKVVEEEEEMEDDEEEEPVAKSATIRGGKAGTAKKASPKTSIKYDAKWLCALIEEKFGKVYAPTALRILLRKMQDAGELGDREAKTRYNFEGGETDPVVRAILKKVKGGAIDKARTEKLNELKSKKASSSTAKKKVALVEDLEDEDFEDEDDEEE